MKSIFTKPDCECVKCTGKKLKKTKFDEHLLDELVELKIAKHYILIAMDEPYFIRAIKQVSKVHGKKFVKNIINGMIDRV